MLINDVLRIAKPAIRPLRVYVFDPGSGRYVGNEMIAEVPFEDLGPGPVGERFAVIDYDGSQKTFYQPVNLDDPHIAMRQGLDPSEADPRFHQQMVYAVASETLQRFEVALGRQVHWAKFDTAGKDGKAAGPLRLCLFPHAMVDANAFYSRDAQGILFGYFRASDTNPGHNLPGQTIYSCLSHDIIAHETTHAILDGVRSYFSEPTNIDVTAFHEAFADISALFCHFSHRDVLLDTLIKTGGQLYETTLKAEIPTEDGKTVLSSQVALVNPLAQLAMQFGEASGMGRGLRKMLGSDPDTGDINTLVEPHARGAILVAAVFDAYFTIYTRRTADLFRIYRAGGGSADPIDLPDALAHRLAEEAGRTAEEFFTACARALDYCPPVDIVFSDFLRAMLTAHADIHHRDSCGVRQALMEAFRARGIVPRDAESLTENSICWPQVQKDTLPPIEGLIFGDPNGLTSEEQDHNGAVLRAYAAKNAAALGFASDHGPIDAPSFHPIFRTGPQGTLIIDMVVELVETQIVHDEDLGPYPFRSGVTLLIWQEFQNGGVRSAPQIHYVIPKHRTPEREERQQLHFASLVRDGRHDCKAHLKQNANDHEIASAWKIDFGLVHAGL